MTTFRPGIRPNDPARQRLHLGRYLTGAPITPAPAVNWGRAVGAWGMDGNDAAGDCFWAMCSHQIAAWTANASVELDPTTAETLQAYSEATGYDPARPDTDQGTVMQDGLNFWRKTGIAVRGTRHRILAFAQVDHANTAELQAAADLFGGVLLAIAFPASAMDQFNAGRPWDVVKGSPIEGGHAILSVRYDAASGTWWAITWGGEQEVTPAFLAKYLQEAWVAIGPEWVEANGATPSGLDLQGLGADLATLTGAPNPFPTPPGPPAFPGALVAAVQALAGDPKVATFLGRAHIGVNEDVAGHVRAILAAPRS